jgi:zinc/manganese transport system permease protein
MSTIMLQYEFMRTAFVASAVVAIVAGCVGYFLVLRGQTFAGHALAHVGFTGATGAVLIGASPLAGLVLLTVAAGLGMGLLGDRLANRDVAIGLVLALALGLGLLFLHFFTSFATQATSLLFGNILAVSTATVWMLMALGVLCLGILGMISRPLLFASLQPELADAKGVHLKLLSAVFLAIVALATAECAQVVGVLLVFALMVGPAATAQRLTTKITAGILLSAALALIEAWSGLALAFYTDWPTSFWITAISTVLYLLSISPVPRFIRVAGEQSA